MPRSKTPDTTDAATDPLARADDAMTGPDAPRSGMDETPAESAREADDGNPLAEAAPGTPEAPASDADRVVEEILAAPLPSATADPAQLDVAEPAQPGVEEEEDHPPAPRRSFAATALTLLVALIAGAALAIWGAPKLAPHLPPTVAAWVTPQAPETVARIDGLEAAIAAQKAALAQNTAALEQAQSALAALGTAVEALKAQPAGDPELAAKVAKLEAAASVGADPAALAALTARIDALTPPDDSALKALEAQIAKLSGTVAETAAAAAQSEQARASAQATADTAVKDAAAKTALAALTAHLATGAAYDGDLARVVDLTGAPAPEALAAHAAGVPTLAAIASGFPLAAQAALAADVASTDDGTTLGAATTWLFSQVTPRPTAETSGDSVGAILSRVSARLSEQALPKALAEAETLPEHSKAALGPWLTHLSARVAAEQALDAWSTALGLNG